MFQQAGTAQLNDYFRPLSERGGSRVFFCRIAGYGETVAAFLRRYYEAARRSGVIIDGRIPNPTPDNLSYFNEMMGSGFQMDRDFLSQRLKKWLPRMTDGQRDAVVTAMYATLDDMRRAGKNDNMLRNAYMKYMCWLYYKFERIVNVLGGETLPKILYAGDVSHYELQLLTVLSRAGADIVLLECGGSVSKLTSRAVYLLCWLNRYQKDLFPDWKAPEVAVFLQFGRCASDTGALFLRLLARLPVDVLLLLPNLNEGSALHTPDLLEVHCPQSVSLDRFPVDQNQARVTTAAYQAERDLDRLMYQDTGLYRNQQYAKASTVLLQTMYEEIPILWDQEMKYRPSFSAAGDTVTLPVICQKICGVKDGNASQYWLDIKKLITPDTEVVRSVPWVQGTDPNPVKPYATQFLKNGKLLRGKIKSHSAYLYGILRAEMQEHLLDKLQLLLDQKLIRGTFENGTEYTVIATALNLPKDLLRKIQKFDFTKKNPKLIYINPTEERISLEDSILTAFLSLVGFDVLFFVPTGYQCIEQHFTRPFASETQIGDYLYDLRIPDFNTVQESGLHSIRKLFGRSI